MAGERLRRAVDYAADLASQAGFLDRRAGALVVRGLLGRRAEDQRIGREASRGSQAAGARARAQADFARFVLGGLDGFSDAEERIG